MRHLLAVLLLPVLPLGAVSRWDKRVEKAARAVELRAAAEPGELAVDTRLRAAELLKNTHPQLARKFALQVVGVLEKSKRRDDSTQRVTEILLALDPAEAQRVTAALPEQSEVRDAMLGYWTRKQDFARAAEIVREDLRAGRFGAGNVSYLLSKMKEKDAAGAAALFRDVLAAFPARNAAANDALFLLRSMREVADIDADAARRASLRLLEALTAADFKISATEKILGHYKVGEETLKAENTRETLLIPLGMFLSVLEPEAYRKSADLFAAWDKQIRTVNAAGLAKASLPVRMSYMSTSRTSETPEPPKPAPPDYSKMPFAEAFEKIRAAPDGAPRLLLELLRREDLSAAQQDLALRELIDQLPRTSLENSRVRLAQGTFELCLERDIRRWVRPAAEALLSALSGGGSSREAALAYASLAAGVRQGRLRLAASPPSLAARTALLDLRDLLEQRFDFTLTSLDGRQYRLRDQRGKVVLLNFWATW